MLVFLVHCKYSTHVMFLPEDTPKTFLSLAQDATLWAIIINQLMGAVIKEEEEEENIF